MADVADGRTGSDARTGPPLREIQQGQGPLRRGALSEGSTPPLWRARPAARPTRICGGRLFHRRHRDLAVDLALRMADDRHEPVSEREALVSGDRRAARGAEGLQGSKGRWRRSAALKVPNRTEQPETEL